MMTISRRGLFGFLASLPIVGPAIVRQTAPVSVDPPMIAVGDAIQGGTNLYAGAINWTATEVEARMREVLRPIPIEEQLRSDDFHRYWQREV